MGRSKHILYRVAGLGMAVVMASSPALFTTPLAAAVEPAEYGPEDHPPPDDDPAPVAPMVQRTHCATSAVLPDSQFDTIPAHEVFGVSELQRHATGKGQTVAVIDSGVNPNARLPRLEGGGDYIMSEDGLFDCDHHGTLIAGIIGAQPARNDSFVGIAPDSSILSIRQTSGAYGPEDRSSDTGSSTVSTLSRAIVRAANMGSTVINLSVTACVPGETDANLSELIGALHYAAVERNAVVVASAGNVDQTCTDNPGPDPGEPGDPRGWDEVETLSLPSYIDDYVLSVGGHTLSGAPYENTMSGPWVDVTAPSVDIVSLDPVTGEQGGLINAEVGQQGTTTISGTSFAAAYVSGLAALIRELHPELDSEQVRNRIINSSMSSAQGLNNVVGFGAVNPLMALTGSVDGGSPDFANAPSQPIDHVPEQAGPSRAPLFVSVGMALVLGVVGLVTLIVTWFRSGASERPRYRTHPEDENEDDLDPDTLSNPRKGLF